MIEKNIQKNIFLEKTAKNLINNFFEVFVVGSRKESLKKLIEIIPKNSSIGYGGSKSLEEIGFFDHFTRERYPNLFDRKAANMSPEQKAELQKKAITADFFLSSANAISQNGEIVLIDKWGNRSGPMTYGPKKRIFIVGYNKITKDLSSALDRAQNIAAVENNIRFDTKNPCTLTGQCMNCDSENRLCSITTIIHKSQPHKSAFVILVSENLGF